MCGLMHRSNQHLHSITSSTRTNSVAGTSRSRVDGLEIDYQLVPGRP
jgi:hypothetical protein